MKVMVVGGGGREHALVWKLAGERLVSEILCVPGNAGISGVATCLPGDVGDPVALEALAEREHVDLTVVGPELPLERGIVDRFVEHGRHVFGPTRAAARLETSKIFAKEFMSRHGVPTARHAICTSADAARQIAECGDLGFPLVLKADGLAAGKGVVLAPDRDTAVAAIQAAMVERRFGDAGTRLVLEECLTGTEASFFVVCDGRRATPLLSAQDHKRVFDEDKGPNTGGMGAFAPSPLVTPALERRIMREIVEPVVEGMRGEGCPFRGFLYVGLMLTSSGPQVIEFNVRFGDPEAQVVIPMIDGDLLPVLLAASAGDLAGLTCRFRPEPHVGVVLASRGYPDRSESGQPIEGLEQAAALEDVLVFHAGTAVQSGRIVTAGGRVLCVVGRGSDYQRAIDRAYAAVARVSFDGMQFRRDIGRKALEGRRDA
jgi:phosphoribosylamine--glycine ligase